MVWGGDVCEEEHVDDNAGAGSDVWWRMTILRRGGEDGFRAGCERVRN